ncbi:ubiquinone biosynthesis O-methyltransferase-like [Macrosteles quadrilineatus]|uniref:ubiquinone biosynthesis O-methyltransferase-like n=1 Tax=Macrosteles quadrilineatus TaxID=74068 RepID=UPI0023E27699|nr:ubiquinone biosynthesis O-methyltransferase-like [Macrosteles quadrilineatus]
MAPRGTVDAIQQNMGPVETMRDETLVYKSEIESHEAHSSHWWDLKGSMRPLHAMNKLRLPLIKDGLLATGRISESQAAKKTFLEGLRILDVGCGGGILCEALAQAGGYVTGVDPSGELIAVARQHATSLNVRPPTYVCDTIEHHSAQYPDHYDVVIASEVVEHVPNPESFMTGCVAALKPGGSLFTTTPNRTVLSWFGAIFICENVLKIVPSGFHSWKQFIHHPELMTMIRNKGCNVCKVRGMFYDPIRNKWSWCFTPTLMYAIHSVKAH